MVVVMTVDRGAFIESTGVERRQEHRRQWDGHGGLYAKDVPMHGRIECMGRGGDDTSHASTF